MRNRTLEINGVERMTDTDAALPEKSDTPALREVRHEYTHSLPALLNQLGISLLVSTYQAGKVVAVGVAQGELSLSYNNFERAMGLAVKPEGVSRPIRVGADGDVRELCPGEQTVFELNQNPATIGSAARN